MDELLYRLPFFFHFFACKLLETLYLIVSLRSVDLKCTVMMTDKTRHSGARLQSEDKLKLELQTRLRALVWSSAFRLCSERGQAKA